MDLGDDCSVCKEQFTVGEELLKLPCTHLYHRDCVIPWLKLVSQPALSFLQFHGVNSSLLLSHSPRLSLSLSLPPSCSTIPVLHVVITLILANTNPIKRPPISLLAKNVVAYIIVAV
jgi:hypothetical protein